MPAALLQFLGSLAAVAAIVALAWLVGSRQGAHLSDEKEARELFRLAPGGFEPVDLAVDTQGGAAIARDADGRLAILMPHGNQFVFRLLPPGIAIEAKGDSLVIACLPGMRITIGEGVGVWATADSGDNSA